MQKIGFCERYMLTTAVLNRTKELTRRLEKALESAVENYKKKYGEEPVIKYQEWVKEGNFLRAYCEHGLLSFQTRYKLGEVVAVAQAYKDAGIDPHYLMFATVKENFSCVEKEIEAMFTKGWSNKLFVKPDLMPHQIQITGVRIERLQDITDEDCLKEGIRLYTTGIPQCKTQVVGSLELIPPYGFDDYHYKHFCNFDTPREAFAALINRPGVGRNGLWESNPWVVVYTFNLIK